MKLIVIAGKLNRRSAVPSSFADKNVTGTVLKGFRFDGEEIADAPNPALGKWFRDQNGSFYWGGGLVIESVPPPAVRPSLAGLPDNLPPDYRLGIDLSHHNERPDWAGFKAAGISFCFIKTSEGVGTRDKKVKEHTVNARNAGLRTGYYHFCRPDTRNGGTITSDALAEANEALSIIGSLGFGNPPLPLVLDLEDTSSWDSPLDRPGYLLWINTFIRKVNETGIKTMIYSRKEYLDRRLPAKHDLAAQKLWIAHYSQKDYRNVRCPNGWQEWSAWQYTETGAIGSNPRLDINILKDPTLF